MLWSLPLVSFSLSPLSSSLSPPPCFPWIIFMMLLLPAMFLPPSPPLSLLFSPSQTHSHTNTLYILHCVLSYPSYCTLLLLSPHTRPLPYQSPPLHPHHRRRCHDPQTGRSVERRGRERGEMGRAHTVDVCLLGTYTSGRQRGYKGSGYLLPLLNGHNTPALPIPSHFPSPISPILSLSPIPSSISSSIIRYPLSRTLDPPSCLAHLISIQSSFQLAFLAQ